MQPDRLRGLEWLETDGLGGFASGTASGERSRRYHALLLQALRPPARRMVLVNGADVWAETTAGRFPLSEQMYLPNVRHPNGADYLERFDADPWPAWSFRLPDGTQIAHELFVAGDPPVTVLSWRLLAPPPRVIVTVRPLISGRDYHALHYENGNFAFGADEQSAAVAWRPYPDVPAIVAETNGSYRHDPVWYRRCLYREELARGLDHAEDLASPGCFHFDHAVTEALFVLSADPRRAAPGACAASASGAARAAETLAERCARLRASERSRRTAFPTRLHRAADAYFVRRGSGKTIIAGYPWFGDWGRDTFIALRGLAIAGGRLDDARAILREWAAMVSMGMLPNRFAYREDAAEFNSADAALWFVVAVHDYLSAREARGEQLEREERRLLRSAVAAILDGYAAGTRYNIRAGADGLLAAGVPGVPVTWMDAKCGERAVTPRIGKPVELQALWLNALAIGARFGDRWSALRVRASASFHERFWNESAGCLFDVIDVDHVPGRADSSVRPNQIFAAGGLPFPILEGERAERVVRAVESRLLTPLGLRSLAPGEPGYARRYEGGARERAAAYHQGTAWPWLIGAFVEAWVRVRGGGAAVREEARIRFVEPLLAHLDEAGIGHVSEIADADAPHTPRGCPFQAWSLGELMRLTLGVLAPPAPLPLSPAAEERAERGGAPRKAQPAALPRSVTRIAPAPERTQETSH